MVPDQEELDDIAGLTKQDPLRQSCPALPETRPYLLQAETWGERSGFKQCFELSHLCLDTGLSLTIKRVECPTISGDAEIPHYFDFKSLSSSSMELKVRPPGSFRSFISFRISASV